MSNKMETKGKDTSVLSDEFKTRRRLLKASAAAPLIATLTPNASAALGSVAQCALNGIDDPNLQGTEPISPTNETAVQVEGIIYTKQNQPTIYRVPAESDDYYYSSPFEPVPFNKIPRGGWNQEPAYFLQLFQIGPDGSIDPPEGAVFFLAPMDSHAIAGTCWTSIMAAP